MKGYSKCLIALAAGIFAALFSDYLIIQLSKSPNGTNSDSGFIEVGIVLIIGVMVACTTIILFAINSNKHNQSIGS